MGWKTVRTLGAILCVGRLFPTVNPKYPPFRVFLSVILLFLCVFGEICHAEAKKDAEKICRKKELKEVQKEDARMLKIRKMQKIRKEKDTVEFMIRLYCRRRHGAEGLCAECEALLRYSQARLDSCPFDGSKKSCRKCSIHCYSPEMREKIREVMRYSGPRMFFYSPFEAFRHI